ncbi:DUF7941 domain-family protein [Paraburkholderia sediminicola]|uniref:DUF7941 domain-family protein n=1 Tax=Paraburkholderia sediminicola TaxID=458836 RepID=UPI0038BA4CF3
MDSTERLIELLNSRNEVPLLLTRSAVEFVDVTPVTSGPYNTVATMQPIPGSSWTDSVVVHWNRVDLAKILDGSGLLSDNDLTPQEVVDKINANWVTWLTLDDLESFSPPDTSDMEIHDLMLKARADSLGWFGTVTMAVSRPGMSALDQLFSVTMPATLAPPASNI